MSNKPKTYFNWSSGKDASMALYHTQKEGKLAVGRLITSINSHHNRVSMHGLRRELLERQAKEIGIPLDLIELPEMPDMEVYNAKMSEMVNKLLADGYTDCVFGDIFLEDLRTYREEKLAPLGISSHFPLWKRNTTELIKEFVALGFRATIICIQASKLDKSFLGKEIDADFLRSLPADVDPCGENGEFHTFCFDGPIFQNPVPFSIGEKVYREYKNPDGEDVENPDMGFWFCDLIPK
ncbi:Dph6-related ATP pyrophosphatase [Poritiphilus flavus]|nr:diphthine--ammonia ligase [Poritiphilus flavus]